MTHPPRPLHLNLPTRAPTHLRHPSAPTQTSLAAPSAPSPHTPPHTPPHTKGYWRAQRAVSVTLLSLTVIPCLLCALQTQATAAPGLAEQRGVRQGEALMSAQEPPAAEARGEEGAREGGREPCGADPFEPNDKRPRARNASAALLAERELEGATCGGDEDWFWVWLNRGQLVEVTLSGEGVDAWPPVGVFAPRKRTAQAGVRRARGSQRVKVYARKSGRYRLKVRGRGEERARYHLSLRALGPR